MKSINELFLESVKKRFLMHKDLAEKAMDQLQPAQLFFVPPNDSNSIAKIIQHTAGNMLSRWTDFLTTDGEKEWRARDNEFENIITDKPTLLALWNKGWECFLAALNSLQPHQLTATIYIRKEPLTVLDAINRQLAHYPYHVGQIVYIAKMLKETEWESLSIPKKKN